MPAAQEFRESLRVAMARRGWTQAELAAKSNVHRVTLNRILQGHLEPSLSVAEKLADALGKPLGKFFSQAS